MRMGSPSRASKNSSMWPEGGGAGELGCSTGLGLGLGRESARAKGRNGRWNIRLTAPPLSPGAQEPRTAAGGQSEWTGLISGGVGLRGWTPSVQPTVVPLLTLAVLPAA